MGAGLCGSGCYLWINYFNHRPIRRYRRVELVDVRKNLMATYKPVTQAEADAMFLFWQESGRNVLRTAKHFNKGRTSIHRYIKKFKWTAKADQIDRDKTKAISHKQIDDLTMVQAIQNKVAKHILEKCYLLDKISVSDFVAITRLKLEIQGELPLNAPDNIVNVIISGQLIKELACVMQEESDQIGGDNADQRPN